MTLRGIEREKGVVPIASRLVSLWTPSNSANTGFVDQTQARTELCDRMRQTKSLGALFHELHGFGADSANQPPSDEALCFCLELIQLMENAFLALRLDEYWNHPDNRGWVELFTMWAQSPTFRKALRQYRTAFGIRFVYFGEQRLGV